MFSQAAFNRLPFNREFSVDVMLSGTLNGNGKMEGSLYLDVELAGKLAGEGILSLDILRELFFGASLDAKSELFFDLLREIFFQSGLEGHGMLKGTIGRFHASEIVVAGPFVPGDKIVIDAAKLKVTKNGTLVGYEGSIFELRPGTNELKYSDAASGRSILVRVTHRDRFV
jgi:hypothetical protein